jgi:hypothetical protein
MFEYHQRDSDQDFLDHSENGLIPRCRKTLEKANAIAKKIPAKTSAFLFIRILDEMISSTNIKLASTCYN